MQDQLSARIVLQAAGDRAAPPRPEHQAHVHVPSPARDHSRAILLSQPSRQVLRGVSGLHHREKPSRMGSLTERRGQEEMDEEDQREETKKSTERSLFESPLSSETVGEFGTETRTFSETSDEFKPFAKSFISILSPNHVGEWDCFRQITITTN